jgi:predicted enzyme related to lactoylglutathione lyase
VHVHHHAPGSFCWFELATTDQTAANAFYASLFGWEITDTPLGPGETYTIFKIDNRAAAAAHTMDRDQRALGVPPAWLLYVSVENVDAAAKRADSVGGTVLAPPFDVTDAGRMTVVRDPTGASLALWEPRNNHGAGIVHEPGTCVWAYLYSPNPRQAAIFYGDLFGWTVVAGKNMAPATANDYGHVVNGTDFIGGMLPAAYVPAGTPPHWLPYFSVSRCDAAVAKTTASGGQVRVPTTKMEAARKYAILADPQSAAFAVVETLR